MNTQPLYRSQDERISPTPLQFVGDSVEPTRARNDLQYTNHRDSLRRSDSAISAAVHPSSPGQA